MGALHGVGEAARNVGHSVLLTVQERDAFKPLEATLHRFVDAFVDGIVIIAPPWTEAKTAHEVVASFSRVSGLSVAISTSDPRSTPDIQVVTEDQKFGARLAVCHLVRFGHQHIVHLAGDQKWLDGGARLKGWWEELLNSGLPALEPVLGDQTGQSSHHAGVRIIKEDLLDAVFVAFDLMALGVIRAFNETGVRVPEDVSVMGFSDHEPVRQFSLLLITVRQNFRALGLRCPKVLLSDSDDDHLSEPVHPCLLVRLGTCRRARPQSRTGRTRQYVGSITDGLPIHNGLARTRRAGSLASIPIVHPVTP